MSTNFNAGIDTSDIDLSYAEEVSWGVLPAVAFTALRVLSESLSETKERTRPAEIRNTGDMAHGITTQVSAGGDVAFGVSYNTYHDLLEGMVNGSWTTPLAINGVAADISLATAGTITSSTVGKFTSIVVGQWIQFSGSAVAANNTYYRVTAKAGDTLTVSPAPAANDTPTGTNAAIRGTMLRNGVDIHTYWMQKRLAAALFLNYAGAYVTGGNLSAELGGFFEGSMTVLAKSEEKGTVNSSTGAVTAAPTGQVISTVNGIQSLIVGDAVSEVITSITIDITKEGARGQYGLGSPDAQGMGRGSLMVNGGLEVYFSSFDLYDRYVSEADTLVSFRALDSDGAGYIITLPAVVLLNPQIVAGGPDTDLTAQFEMEANPASDGVYDGTTIQIDSFPAAA